MPAIVKRRCKLGGRNSFWNGKRFKKRKNKTAESAERLISTHFCGFPLYQFRCCDVTMPLQILSWFYSYCNWKQIANQLKNALPTIKNAKHFIYYIKFNITLLFNFLYPLHHRHISIWYLCDFLKKFLLVKEPNQIFPVPTFNQHIPSTKEIYGSVDNITGVSDQLPLLTTPSKH